MARLAGPRQAALDVTGELGEGSVLRGVRLLLRGRPRLGWSDRIRPDDGEPPKVIVFCPPCAASEFGYRPCWDGYVCAWEPLPNEATEE